MVINRLIDNDGTFPFPELLIDNINCPGAIFKAG